MSQTAKPTPQSGKFGIFSTERKGHLAQWIKCWCQQETREHLMCAGGIPAWLFFMLGFLSSFFLLSPGRTQLQGAQNHHLCWFAPVCTSAIQDCSSWDRGLGPTPGCIHALDGFGGQTKCFTTSSFPSFPTQNISQLLVITHNCVFPLL